MRSVFAILALCLVAGMASAAFATPSASSYTGRWAVRIGERDLIVITLAEGSGSSPVVGALERPQHFSLNGQLVSEVGLPVIREAVTRARLTDAALQFSVQNPSDPKDTDEFEFRLTGADAGALSFAFAPSASMAMVRVPPDTRVATDWNPEATYGPEVAGVSNADMKRLFDADQADRRSLDHVDWGAVAKADAERRRAVATLLKGGELHTGTDFMYAAFVFQHGDKPDDFLLAHVLAMVAVKKGRTDAIWIEAATLDRYLQRTGKPQVFGTQFASDGKARPTQEPFDRSLIDDALRAEMNVPALNAQMTTFDSNASAR